MIGRAKAERPETFKTLMGFVAKATGQEGADPEEARLRLIGNSHFVEGVGAAARALEESGAAKEAQRVEEQAARLASRGALERGQRRKEWDESVMMVQRLLYCVNLCAFAYNHYADNFRRQVKDTVFEESITKKVTRAISTASWMVWDANGAVNKALDLIDSTIDRGDGAMADHCRCMTKDFLKLTRLIETFMQVDGDGRIRGTGRTLIDIAEEDTEKVLRLLSSNGIYHQVNGNPDVINPVSDKLDEEDLKRRLKRLAKAEEAARKKQQERLTDNNNNNNNQTTQDNGKQE